MESEKQQLQRDLSDAHTSLENQAVVHEAHRRSEESLKQLKEDAKSQTERESSLKAECSELCSQNQSLTGELETLRASMERDLEKRVERESEKLILVEQERDLVKAELEALRAKMEWELEQRVKQESEKLLLVEQERDRVKAELEEAGSLVEDATSALKFQLSSQNIELQQVKEVRL